MSFSTDVKQELSKIANLANKKCVKIEFIGYSRTMNVSTVENRLRFSTESEYNINRFGKLLSNLDIHQYQIELQGKNYVITSKEKKIFDILNENQKIQDEIQDEIEEKAFVRGCFLGSGSINNPENNYHIEIILKEKETSKFILKILQKYNISFKELEKKNGNSIYSKDGEEISKFLAFLGANTAVLKFEDIRVYRDMRNNVNRIVNCETANLSKTVNAAIKQIEAIQLLKEKGEFRKLSDNLKEIAELRTQNPEASLVELGNMLKQPIGKSGVNHRLKAIMKIAEEMI